MEVLRGADADAAFNAEVDAKVAELTRDYDAAIPSKNMLARQQGIDKDTKLVLGHQEPTMKGYYRVLVIARIGEAVASFKADVYKQNKPEDIESKMLAVAAFKGRMRRRRSVSGRCSNASPSSSCAKAATPVPCRCTRTTLR